MKLRIKKYGLLATLLFAIGGYQEIGCAAEVEDEVVETAASTREMGTRVRKATPGVPRRRATAASTSRTTASTSRTTRTTRAQRARPTQRRSAAAAGRGRRMATKPTMGASTLTGAALTAKVTELENKLSQVMAQQNEAMVLTGDRGVGYYNQTMQDNPEFLAKRVALLQKMVDEAMVALAVLQSGVVAAKGKTVPVAASVAVPVAEQPAAKPAVEMISVDAIKKGIQERMDAVLAAGEATPEETLKNLDTLLGTVKQEMIAERDSAARADALKEYQAGMKNIIQEKIKIERRVKPIQKRFAAVPDARKDQDLIAKIKADMKAQVAGIVSAENLLNDEQKVLELKKLKGVVRTEKLLDESSVNELIAMLDTTIKKHSLTPRDQEYNDILTQPGAAQDKIAALQQLRVKFQRERVSAQDPVFAKIEASIQLLSQPKPSGPKTGTEATKEELMTSLDAIKKHYDDLNRPLAKERVSGWMVRVMEFVTKVRDTDLLSPDAKFEILTNYVQYLASLSPQEFADLGLGVDFDTLKALVQTAQQRFEERKEGGETAQLVLNTMTKNANEWFDQIQQATIKPDDKIGLLRKWLAPFPDNAGAVVDDTRLNDDERLAILTGYLAYLNGKLADVATIDTQGTLGTEVNAARGGIQTLINDLQGEGKKGGKQTGAPQDEVVAAISNLTGTADKGLQIVRGTAQDKRIAALKGWLSRRFTSAKELSDSDEFNAGQQIHILNTFNDYLGQQSATIEQIIANATGADAQKQAVREQYSKLLQDVNAIISGLVEE